MATKKKPPAPDFVPDFRAIAQSLVHKYLRESTHEERSKKSKKAVATRWKGKEESERVEYMRTIAKRPRPSRVIQDRCPCGKYSQWLADKRGHKCGPLPKTTKPRSRK